MKTDVEKTITVDKKELLERLGLENKRVTYINYNYSKGKLIIKCVVEDNEDDSGGGWFEF